MASEEALKQARETVDDLIVSDSNVYIPTELYKSFVERIAAAIDGPPATAEMCVKCGHNNLTNGLCHEEVQSEGLTPIQMVELHQEFWDGSILCCGCKCEFDAPTAAGPADNRHPEDYCHKCGGPNISWYAPSLLWNQFVRAKNEPEIICPICFVQLAKASGSDVTWSLVPDGVTSDYDERLAVRAAQRIINATIQSEEEAMVIVRDALVQSAAALAAARPAPDLEAVAQRAAEKIQVRYIKSRG
jgi:hypothetical protein